MRPLIGVTPLLDTKLDSYWMLPDRTICRQYSRQAVCR